MQKDNFIEIPYTTKNLDRFYIRSSIKEAIVESLPFLKGNLLDVGCGKKPYEKFILNNSKIKKYTGLDIEAAIVYDENIKPDYTWDGLIMPFENNSFDCAIATEVLEHCPDPEIMLKEVYRVLKTNGAFVFTVPFLWNLHETPNDQYRYTPFSLQRHLTNSGFTNIQLKATGGWNSSLAQMLGLWVRRSPLNKNIRKILSILLKPVIKLLIKKDRKRISIIEFKDGQMITGIKGIAYKK